MKSGECSEENPIHWVLMSLWKWNIEDMSGNYKKDLEFTDHI